MAKNFLQTVVTNSNNKIAESDYNYVSSGEEIMIQEGQEDYVLTNIYDDEQKNHVDKCLIGEIIDETNCEIIEVLDLLGIIYRAYSEHISYIKLDGMNHRTKEYRKQCLMTTIDNEKIKDFLIYLLTKYNSYDAKSVLSQMNPSTGVEIIFDGVPEAFDTYFEEEDIKERPFVMQLRNHK